MRTFRRDTPRATPLVRLPPRPKGGAVKGQPLVGPVRILKAAEPFELPVGKVVVFGRDASCDFVLDDPLASRHHVQIVVSKDNVVLEDLKSTNGVYVNCIRVQRSVRLCAGDRVLLGTTELSVFAAESP